MSNDSSTDRFYIEDTEGDMAPERETARRIPYNFAKTNGLIAARENREDGFVEVWMREGGGAAGALAEIRRVFKAPLRVKIVAPRRFDLCLESVFTSDDNSAYEVMESIERSQSLQHLADELPQNAELLESVDDAPIIRFINTLLTQALREKASDIHIEIFGNRSLVRFRVDGVLRNIVEPNRALHTAIVSRIKVMANLDIAEKRLPQDGRFTLRLAGRPVDVRISTLPTGYGEKTVLRLLDKQQETLDLHRLGMSGELEERVDTLIHRPHGIILVTGPTGSGKTTTLYAALSRLDSKKLNIMTVEDPIEYDLDGINQTQVDARIDMTFAKALRSILRQDPDVVMIGEIRDLETARIAVQASITGHLVLATLHTNDSVGAITRLIDMGVEPYLLASSLHAVIAQRLVRSLCPSCKRPYQPDSTEMKMMGDDWAHTIFSVSGCGACGNTGYRGRTGIFEMFELDDEARRLIHDQSPEYKLRDYVLNRRSMATLRQDGIRLVRNGDTTLEEVLRVTES